MSEPFDADDLDALMAKVRSPTFNKSNDTTSTRRAPPAKAGGTRGAKKRPSLSPFDAAARAASLRERLEVAAAEAKALEQNPVPKNRPKRISTIPIDLKEAPVTEDDPFGIAVAVENDSKVSSAFSTMVKFQGDRNAVFLIITDCPDVQDADHDPPILDCKHRTRGAFKRVIDNFYAETFTTGQVPRRRNPATYSTALVSLSLGHSGDRFRSAPNAVEVGASAPHIRRLIMNMPNLRLVYVMGKHAEEFFIHNLDAHQMYGVAPDVELHRHHTVSATMAGRNSTGKYGNAYIDGHLSFRYYSLPWLTHQKFNEYLISSLFRIEDAKFPLIKYPVDARPYDISQPPLLEDHTKHPEDYFDYDSFRNHLHSHLKKESTTSCLDDLFDHDYDDDEDICPDDSQASPPPPPPSLTVVPRPTDMFVNAALEPYLSYDRMQPMYMCVRNTQYDPINNHMNLYCSTPSSTSVLVSVVKPTFSIYLSPHPAFAGEGGLWESDSTRLQDHHLNHLRTFVSKKLYYKFRDRAYCLPTDGTPAVSFELVAGKHDESDGYWHNRRFMFIRVDVAHHALLDAVFTQLKKLIETPTDESESSYSGGTTSFRKSTTSSKKDAEKFKIFGYYSPEKMFTYKYRVYMSTWHRITGLAISPPIPLAPESGVTHTRLLYAKLDPAWRGAKIEFLKPADNIPLYEDHEVSLLDDDPSPLTSPASPMTAAERRMTSSDTPVDIRAAFDIETWFERGVKDFDNTPVICICMSVRKHDNKITKFDSKAAADGTPPTFTPLDGYHYFTFMMGKTAPPNRNSELLGPEFLFEFYREDHLLSAFFYFKHLLMPTYVQGHNSKGFDEVKLFARARMIGADLAPQGWRPDQQTRLTVKKFKSIAKGERRQYFAEGQEGTCHVDTLQVAMNELNRNSYQLSSLAADLVGMTKHDMPYDAIKGHWTEGPVTRRTLVDYCIRDAQLPDQINTKRQTIATMCELSRVTTNVTEDRLHDEGMQIKVLGAELYTNAEFGGEALLPTSKNWMKSMNQQVDENICSSNKHEIDRLMKRLYFGEDDNPTGGDEEVVAVRPPPKKKVKRDVNDETIKESLNAKSSQSALEFGKEYGPALPTIYDYNPDAKIKPDGRSIAQKRALVDDELARSQADDGGGKRRKAEYDGATVMEAHKGWYRDVPLVGVDFAALYPTTIIANNIARNTQVYEDEMVMRGVTEDMCLPPPPGLVVTNPRTGRKVRVFYVKPEYRIGLMVRTEIELLARRNVAKRLIDFYGKEFEEDGVTRNPNFNKNLAEIVTQRSNGLKLVANSGYGMLGTNTENGNMHCAASVTAFGRYYIGLCKTEVERLWNGYVAGGDTDSIFVGFAGDKDGNFRYATTTEAENFAMETVIPTLNKLFPAPVKLDFEKTMVYFVAVAKKRYIYWLCNKGQKPYLNFKGLEIVRRDSLPFTKKTMLNCLDILQEWPKEKLSKEEDQEWVRVRKQRAVEHIKQRARTLLAGELSIGDLKLSKSISREYYTNRNQEHLSVVDKLLKRDLPAPGIGDRVYFVYTKSPTPENLKGEMKGYMIADDPEYVIRNDAPIDYKYYFRHKFEQPIVSIMTHFLMDDMTKRFFKRNPHKQDVTMKELAAETRAFLFNDVCPSKKNLATETTRTPAISTFAASSGSSATAVADTTENLIAEDRARYLEAKAAREAWAAAHLDSKLKAKEAVKAKRAADRAVARATKAVDAAKAATTARSLNSRNAASLAAAKEARELVALSLAADAAAAAAREKIARPPVEKDDEAARSSSLARLKDMQLPESARKVVKARADASSSSSIAFFAQDAKLVRQSDEIIGQDGTVTERRRPRAHVRLEYENKISAAKVELDERLARREEVHTGCRACLKIGPDKKVTCRAATCKVYDTRIEAECRVDNTEARLARLQREVTEAMGLLSLDDEDGGASSSKAQRRD